MKRIPLIHIGYAKAGSTTLQQFCFDLHPELFHFAKTMSYNINNKDTLLLRKSVDWFYKEIKCLDSINWNENELRLFYEKSLEPHIPDGKIPVFSNEGFTASSMGDNGLKAYRLKKMFPEAKIMVILRNQIEVVRSLYEMLPHAPFGYPVGFYTKAVFSFDEWLEIFFRHEHQTFANGLKYEKVLALYSELFGEKNIGIFFFEDLATDLPIFVQQISDFIGIDSEVSMSLLKNRRSNSASAHRAINNYRKFRTLLPQNVRLSRLLPPRAYNFLIKTVFLRSKIKTRTEKIIISEVNQEKIREFYKESNKCLLQKMGNKKISQYGYPL